MVTNSELEIKSKDKIPYEISLLNSFNIEGKISEGEKQVQKSKKEEQELDW